MAWCGICEGRGSITLPFRQPVTMSYDEAEEREPASMVEASKRFPCPECRTSRNVDPKRLTAIRVNETVDSRHMKDPMVVSSRKQKLARLIANIIVSRNMVTVTTREAEFGQRTVIEMTLGLVRPKGVAGAAEIREVEEARELPPLPPEFAPPPPKPKPKAARPLGSRQLDLE